MPPKPRWQQAVGAYYHLMNRGHNRAVVFRAEDDAAYFLHLLQRYRQRYALRVYHHCLMRNHFHLLVDCEEPRDSSPCMAGLLRSYVHYFVSVRRIAFLTGMV